MYTVYSSLRPALHIGTGSQITFDYSAKVPPVMSKLNHDASSPIPH